MKAIFHHSQNQSVRIKTPFAKQRSYWTAIWLGSLACSGGAMAQTNTAPPVAAASASGSSTNATPGSSTNVTKLEQTTVVGKLNEARRSIDTSIGATTYDFTRAQISVIPLGQAASFNQVLLRAPGMAEDSLGQIHLRGEHANLQYRINDVILPEGITGFGSEIDTRFVQSMRVITGTLLRRNMDSAPQALWMSRRRAAHLTKVARRPFMAVLMIRFRQVLKSAAPRTSGITLAAVLTYYRDRHREPHGLGDSLA